ncbi:hypothetical protein E2C01_021157 [Portunus trituberculatus]|uniref:Uncharacterized protein n=1 Tax=Portunus trituberculatus TaxID=210409 RepID=A0A5B7E5B1_PORTR|nr:hypothetical protein [Portunus trituberculatus]
MGVSIGNHREGLRLGQERTTSLRHGYRHTGLGTGNQPELESGARLLIPSSETYVGIKIVKTLRYRKDSTRTGWKERRVYILFLLRGSGTVGPKLLLHMMVENLRRGCMEVVKCEVVQIHRGHWAQMHCGHSSRLAGGGPRSSKACCGYRCCGKECGQADDVPSRCCNGQSLPEHSWWWKKQSPAVTELRRNLPGTAGKAECWAGGCGKG